MEESRLTNNNRSGTAGGTAGHRAGGRADCHMHMEVVVLLDMPMEVVVLVDRAAAVEVVVLVDMHILFPCVTYSERAKIDIRGNTDSSNFQMSGRKEENIGRRGRAAVVVLGDIGRSPRMQYHALSLARQASLEVDIVAYGVDFMILSEFHFWVL
ncbi:UDP-glycosyltransferase TURAN [Vitis vinifera]|uniref:UDP-glycosyltransferase TURAN n=1 Tax=Vitis vinifera TaxID=29760 RepID=A0A438F7W8_VITVI|nr:UDP-glycosyltransferase TURAN [Vitis vinifera]